MRNKILVWLFAEITVAKSRVYFLLYPFPNYAFHIYIS